jgi:transcription elongation factor Elf1
MEVLYDVQEWLDAESAYTCPDCGHETFIAPLGSSGLKLRCEDYNCDCYPACTILTPIYDEQPVAYEFPSGYVTRYQCPECDSRDIERRPYDDGLGYVDVKLECDDCGAETWE